MPRHFFRGLRRWLNRRFSFKTLSNKWLGFSKLLQLKPRLERLEDRVVPATVTWDGGAGTFNWLDAANWDTDATPTAADDAVIGDLNGTPTIVVSGNVSVLSVTSSERVRLQGGVSFNLGVGASILSLGIESDTNAANAISLDGTLSTGGVANTTFTGSITGGGTLTNTGSFNFSIGSSNSVNVAVVNPGEIRKEGNGTLTFNGTFDNTGLLDVVAGAVIIDGAVTQHSGDTLTEGTWIVDGSGTSLNFGLGSNITTIGSDAFVSTSGTRFAKVNSVNLNQGTFRVTHGGSFTTAAGFTNEGELTLGLTSIFTVASGNDLTSTGAITMLSGSLLNTDNVRLQSGGSLLGSGTITGNVVSTGGVIDPGNSPGILNINGDLTLDANSVTFIEIAGTNNGGAAPEFDQINVTGNATLAGQLTILDPINFYLDKSETVDFLTYASRTGDFATKNYPTRNGLDLVTTTAGATNYSATGNAYIVRNTNDAGAFSLRNAITSANAAAGTDQILFNIAGTGVHTIAPTTALPTITGVTYIDATTESDYSGTPRIELRGDSAGVGVSGLILSGGNSIVRGFAINRFQTSAGTGGNAIELQTAGGNLIEGNYLGTDASGTTDLGNQQNGITIQNSSNNTIGGTTAAARNVISGNELDGIQLNTTTSTGNIIIGNYIGTNAAGTGVLGNTGIGVRMLGANNRIGGTTAAERNIISGNSGGITAIASGATGNVIQGNYIGTDVTGTQDLGNTFDGVLIHTTSSNTIGGSTLGEGNLISGNDRYGVFLFGSTATQVAGNRIGANATGTAALANNLGIKIDFGSTNNTIGGTNAAQRNIISGNSSFGIQVTGSGTTGNTVLGNYIGLGADGNTVVGNVGSGVDVQSGAATTTIGGNVAGARNVISGNARGIQLDGVSGTVITSNYIGTDATGLLNRGNANEGVRLQNGATNTQIGNSGANERNVISGNNAGGILFFNATTINNTIQNNLIGLGTDGTTALGNTGTGIGINEANGLNTIGGSGAGERNVISSNSTGINLNFGASGINILGNYIGTAEDGVTLRANTTYSIEIGGGANDIDIGGFTTSAGTGSGNVIGGAGSRDISISGAANNVFIRGNLIGVGSDGTTDIGSDIGLLIESSTINSATPVVIGGDDDDDGTLDGVNRSRNVISGHTSTGISLSTSGSNIGTIIQGNYIGTNRAGTGAISNNTGIIAGNAPGTLIGGTTALAGNLISGNVTGVLVNSSNGNVTIQGNVLGLNAAGTAALGNTTGITLNNANNTIGGSTSAARNIISGNTDGVYMAGAGTTNNRVQGNYIGTNAAGTAAIANNRGIYIETDANANIIGTDGDGTNDATEGNLISGNAGGFGAGIQITNSDNNIIAGNIIGLNVSGTVLGNVSGIVINDTSVGNRIGTDGNGTSDILERNVIAGSSSDGIWIANSSNTTVAGNYIGTNTAGTGAVANNRGIIINAGSTNNTIGGTTAAARNVISGNSGDGVSVSGTGSTDNKIQGNYVGLNAAGTAALSNAGYGVVVVQADDTIIGGSVAGSGNVISGSGLNNIRLAAGADSTIISGNIIGLNAAGDTAIVGGDFGIDLDSSSDVTIGGTTAVERNIISGHSNHGIVITGSSAQNNVVLGNYIGTDITGTTAIGNDGGLLIENAASNNTIGGTTAGARNIISGNTGVGVQITGSGTNANTVAGNIIGLNAAGDTDLGNGGVGVQVEIGAANNTIGGATAGHRNIVSGNASRGIVLSGAGTGNLVEGNYVGLDITGAVAIGNDSDGVRIVGTASSTIRSNVISDNLLGISIVGSLSTGNSVVGNYIGTNTDGTTRLGSQATGVIFNTGANNNTVGGTTAADRNIITGLAGTSVQILGTGTNNNTILGNYIGLNATGTVAIANSGGLSIASGASNNTIGGTAAGAGNVISGNTTGFGVSISDAGTTGNTVLGNYIGTNAAGTAAIANTTGVQIQSGASNNTIGGTTAGARNILSGNTSGGILFTGTGTSNNVALGNYIGLGSDGDTIIGNGDYGVETISGASNNTIGGSSAGAGNVISGNQDGIEFRSNGNFAYGNYIGTDATGLLDRGNTLDGIRFVGGSNNTVGGSSAGQGNVVSGNNRNGIFLQTGTNNSNTILGNIIGLNKDGNAALANSTSGIIIASGSNNTIGGSTAGARNIISGNTQRGVGITGAGTTGNVISGNYIGTDVTGLVDLGNLSQGVIVQSGATGNTIGGSAAGAGNVISGNNNAGVFVTGTGTTSNTIAGNIIGLGADGTTVVGNSTEGVVLQSASNTVGGLTAGARNIISGNTEAGIQIDNTGATDNVVVGNYIGTDITGTLSRANSTSSNEGGIYIFNASNNTIGGTTAAHRNVISGNLDQGVWIDGATATGNTVLGNYIGTDATGAAALSNPIGVLINGSAANNTIGGTAAGAGNVISGNTAAGVELNGSGTTGNTVLGNYIGTNAAGTAAIANATGVLIQSAAAGNTIGGITATPGTGAGNVISGNTQSGINVVAHNTTVQGNIIGLDAAGGTPIANGFRGIEVGSTVTGTLIGGTVSGAGNVISGNANTGVTLNSTSSAAVVAGNIIGLDITGTIDLGNAGSGIHLNGATGNTIGGTTAAARNIISGNNGSGGGITLDASAAGNIVLGNYIGTDITGTLALGNSFSGILIQSGAANNTIGGTAAGAGNVISGNTGAGVRINTANGNTVQGNYIGTDSSGTVDLGNGAEGVMLTSVDGATIGGAAAGAGNLISGNNDNGVRADNSTNVLIAGNLIGTDVTGTVAISNVSVGVNLVGTSNSVVGGVGSARNVISANGDVGINLFAPATTGVRVQGNYIGTNAAGNAALGGQQRGVVLTDTGANIIGTDGNGVNDAQEGNVISGHAADGVRIVGSTTGVAVSGNRIGTNAAGTAAIANIIGIRVESANNTIGGTTAGAGNVVSGNTNRGVHLFGSSATGNTVIGNILGLNAAGDADLGNAIGVEMQNGANNNTIGGATAAHRNIISGNDLSGVTIDSSTGNFVQGNYIGTDITGEIDLGNTGSGITFGGTANSNTIGGSTTTAGTGLGNVISGNDSQGINLQTGTGNVIYGNIIGLDKDGDTVLENNGNGILIGGTANTVGQASSDFRNIISGNNGTGVALINSANRVYGNYIGTDITGLIDLGNTSYGVSAQAAANSEIGAFSAGHGNVISGNNLGGVFVQFQTSTGTGIFNNFIGLGANGTTDVGNGGVGVFLLDTTGISVGGSTTTLGSGAGNYISGNDGDGVRITDSVGINGVQGNIIGLNTTSAAMGNGGAGVLIEDSTSTQVGGGSVTDRRNVISSNAYGVIIRDSLSTGNVVHGNLIGTDDSQTLDRGNTVHGVLIEGGARNNTIGGAIAGSRNVIVESLSAGIALQDSTTTSNFIYGNRIGTNDSNATNLANRYGVLIQSGANGNFIGNVIASQGNLISGNTEYGVWITGSGTNNNTITSNFIGTNSAGTAALGNGTDGIRIESGASNNIIGENGVANLISGNAGYGINITGSGTNSNRVHGNTIGLNAAGSAAVGNTLDGVIVQAGAANTEIGGTNSAERNVISGNARNGIQVNNISSGTIINNIIGLDATGTVDLGNTEAGIVFSAGANNITIGGLTTVLEKRRNIISGNNTSGIHVVNGGSNSVITGNYIGTDITGTLDLGNTAQGIYIQSGTSITIGGNTSTAGTGLGNVISGNNQHGIFVDMATTSTTSHIIRGNLIGTNAAGTAAIGNSQSGIRLTNAASNTIGGSAAGDGNVVSGNLGSTQGGIFLSNASFNTIQGNRIGTNITGTAAIGNAGSGGLVLASTAANNNVLNNQLSGNNAAGLVIGGGAAFNIVRGNLIGTDATGTLDLGNATHGVVINTGGQLSTIGGTNVADRNIISGNDGNGIYIDTNTVNQNTILGNYIGLNSNGAALGNSSNGIQIVQGRNVTIGGTAAGAGNVISGNTIVGVELTGTNTTLNTITGNFIGTNAAGTAAIGNFYGVFLTLGANSNTIGGTVAGSANVISGNSNTGLIISGAGTNNNNVRGNFIGTNPTGTTAIANFSGLVVEDGASSNTIGGTTAAARNIISGNSTGGVTISGGGDQQQYGQQ